MIFLGGKKVYYKKMKVYHVFKALERIQTESLSLVLQVFSVTLSKSVPLVLIYILKDGNTSFVSVFTLQTPFTLCFTLFLLQ